MAIKKIYEWDENPNNNIFPGSEGGFPELMPRSDVNDSMRVHLSEMRAHYNDSEWIRVRIVGPLVADIGVFLRTSATQFTINLAGNDFTSFYTAGRLLRIIDGGGVGVDLYSQVVSSSYANPLTTVNITVSDSINAAATDAWVHSSAILRRLSTIDADSEFYVPLTATSAGIQTAIDNASAAGGGTVLLTLGSYNITTALDITGTKGNIVFRGVNPETVLFMPNTTNLDALVNIDTGSKRVAFEHIRFDANKANNTGGLNYCVDVQANLDLNFIDCHFANCDRGVSFGTNAGTLINFDRCRFVGYRIFGIVTSFGAGSFHQGAIANCTFNGASVAVADPAAIKVSGNWVISSNRFLNMGHASVLPRAIWLLNKTAADNGGRLSTVTGNHIFGSAAATGIMIEVGGDGNTVVGNRITTPTAGKGIFVNSSAAGQIIKDTTIDGNSISGPTCIEMSLRTTIGAVTGNTLSVSAASTGVVQYGDNSTIVGNSITGGATGIRLESTAQHNLVSGNMLTTHTSYAINAEGDGTSIASNSIKGGDSSCIRVGGIPNKVYISDNHIDHGATIGIEVVGTPTLLRILDNMIEGATTGINIGASTTRAIIKGNVIVSATTTVVDSGTENNLYGNSGENPIGIPIASGGRYIIFMFVQSNSNSEPEFGNVTGRYYVGALGTTSDPLIGSVSSQCGYHGEDRNNVTRIAHFIAAPGDILTTHLTITTGGGSATSSLLKVGV